MTATAGAPKEQQEHQDSAYNTMVDYITESRKALAEYERAASIYAGLAFVESKLEAERHGVKLEAVKRLMEQINPLGQAGKLHSASSAESVVETDEEYAAHLKLQRETVRDKNGAHTRMESARMRVQIALAAVRAIGGLQ
jgi:hypothetical protein